MKLAASRVELTLKEAGEVLREAVRVKTGFTPDEVHIVSYEVSRVTFQFSEETGGEGVVEGIAFRHRTR